MDPIANETVAFTVKETGNHQLGRLSIDFGDGIAAAREVSLVCRSPESTGIQVSTGTLLHAYSAAGNYQVLVQATVDPCGAATVVEAGGPLVIQPR
jgi:hypothetical protein